MASSGVVSRLTLALPVRVIMSHLCHGRRYPGIEGKIIGDCNGIFAMSNEHPEDNHTTLVACRV
jgi:hypothetical protein